MFVIYCVDNDCIIQTINQIQKRATTPKRPEAPSCKKNKSPIDLNEIIDYAQTFTEADEELGKFWFLRRQIDATYDFSSGLFMSQKMAEIINDNPWITGFTLSITHENDYEELDGFRARAVDVAVDTTAPSYAEFLSESSWKETEESDGIKDQDAARDPNRWLSYQMNEGPYFEIEDHSNDIHKTLNRDTTVISEKTLNLRVDRACIGHLLDDIKGNGDQLFSTLVPYAYAELKETMHNRWNDGLRRNAPKNQ